MKKILAVIRESTEHQEIDSQKKELTEFCISKGFKENQIEYIAESGASARKVNKKYIQMLEDIKETLISKKIKNCAFWHLNRLGRVKSKIDEMQEWFIKNKIQVYIKNPSLTLLNDDGSVNAGAEIAWGIYGVMVKQETDEMFEKMKRGKNRNAENKKYNGGPIVKFGYMLDKDNYVVPNQEEVELVHLIYNEYMTGKYSVFSLAKELNERGITQRGKKLTSYFISKVLTTTAYIGYTNTKKSNRKFTPIISQEMYDKCKEIRTKKNTFGTSTKESKHTALCLKLIKCSECGYNFIKNHNRYVCYHRKANSRFEEKCHNNTSIRLEVLDNIVWDLTCILQLNLLQGDNSSLVDNYKDGIEITQQKQKKGQNKLSQIDDKRQRSKDLYIEGEITKKEYEIKKQKFNNEEVELKQQIDIYKNEIIQLQNKIDKLENPSVDFMLQYADALDNENNAKKMREIVFKHIKLIEVNNHTINERKCVKIKINDVYGNVWLYAYFYTLKRNLKMNKLSKVYQIDDDDNIIGNALVPTEVEKNIIRQKFNETNPNIKI